MVSMTKSDWDLSVFFRRPVSAVLGVITAILWSGPFMAAFRKRHQDVRDSNAETNA
jgi:TctA family transporter